MINSIYILVSIYMYVGLTTKNITLFFCMLVKKRSKQVSIKYFMHSLIDTLHPSSILQKINLLGTSWYVSTRAVLEYFSCFLIPKTYIHLFYQNDLWCMLLTSNRPTIAIIAEFWFWRETWDWVLYKRTYMEFEWCI